MLQQVLLLATEALNALAAEVVVIDSTGAIVLVNDAWSRFARDNGGPPDAGAYTGVNYLAACRDAVGRGDVSARAPLQGIEAVLWGTREAFSIEYPCSTPGRERWFRMSVTRFPSGVSPCAVISHEEITAEKRQQQALVESERTLQAVLDALPVGVWILDADGLIVRANPAGVRIWGGARYVRPDAFGEYKGWWLSTGEPIAAAEWGAARAIRSGETSINEEIEIECFDGTRKIILHSAMPLRDDQGRIFGAIVVNQDVTARMRHEIEREALLREHARLREAAETANRAKDDFIATLSHEMRTPLQALIGWADLLRRRGDAVSAGRAVAAIDRNARVLRQLLADTFDVSRIARGTLTLERTPVDLSSLAADVCEGMRAEALAKGITIADVASEGPWTVPGDPIRLQQIVWNLLANALKFTPAGGRVEVRTRGGIEQVELLVRDTGEGIAPEFLPFVFDRFRQAGGAAGARPGLGLGLAIVKDLVERHGGTIVAESGGPGHGASFTVRLPAAPGAAGGGPEADHVAGR